MLLNKFESNKRQRKMLVFILPKNLSKYIAGEGQNECQSQGIKEFALRLCHIAMSEDTPVKSHQHDCLSMN